MALSISNRLLFLPSICQLICNFLNIPVLIFDLLQQFNPHIGYCHTQPKIKAYSTIHKRPTETWEPRHILRNGHRKGIDGLDNPIGQHEIHQGIFLQILIKVLLIVARKPKVDTMMLVDHGSHTIKPIPINPVLLHPESDIRQQEPQYFVLGVVEDAAVPHRVVSFGQGVEVLVVGAVPHVYALVCVGCCVGVNEVDQHFQAFRVGVVHHLFEIPGSSTPAGDREEVGYMISERSVVGVLHYPHQLDCVVALIHHPVDYVILEIGVAVHFRLDTAHPDVALVDLQLVVGPCRIWEPEFVVVLEKYTVVAGVLVLNCIRNPGGYPILPGAISQLHVSFKFGELWNDLSSENKLPSSIRILNWDCVFTFLAAYSFLFQALNSPKRQTARAPGAHSLQTNLSPTLCTPQVLQLLENSTSPPQFCSSVRMISAYFCLSSTKYGCIVHLTTLYSRRYLSSASTVSSSAYIRNILQNEGACWVHHYLGGGRGGA